MAFYGKVYKYEKEENYVPFIEAFGLPEDKKTFLLNYKPDQKFEKDGDNYTQVIFFNGAEKRTPFKVGEEIDTTLKTANVKSLFTVDDNSITNVLKFGQDYDIVSTIKKVFTGDKMVETITNNKHDLTATIYYSA